MLSIIYSTKIAQIVPGLAIDEENGWQWLHMDHCGHTTMTILGSSPTPML